MYKAWNTHEKYIHTEDVHKTKSRLKIIHNTHTHTQETYAWRTYVLGHTYIIQGIYQQQNSRVPHDDVMTWKSFPRNRLNKLVNEQWRCRWFGTYWGSCDNILKNFGGCFRLQSHDYPRSNENNPRSFRKFTRGALYQHGPLRRRHNERDGVSNHHWLLKRLFRKETSKLRVTGFCAGNSPVTGEFPAQMASNAENVSIRWRHHVHLLQHG